MEFFRKLFKGKDKKVVYNLLITFSIGVTLLVLSTVLLKPKTQDADGSAESTQPPAAEQSGGQERAGSYERALEERMEEILSLVENAGKVRVMLNVSGSGETVLAENVTSDSSKTSESDSAGGTREQESLKEQSSVVLSRQKDGSEAPLVLLENAPAIEGVIIVAEGGGDIVVKDALIRAASALLGVEMHKISVLKMKTS